MHTHRHSSYTFTVYPRMLVSNMFWTSCDHLIENSCCCSWFILIVKYCSLGVVFNLFIF
ncbi:unnamed protein product [Amoebophrya sp. A25]|nr:unnamed protein product [Amoebophrya sp. A25]|eukprot:GSA25T00011880001.1